MSTERGWNALNLRPTDKIPHTQYISHDAFTLARAGVDTRDPGQRAQAWPALARALDYDFIWHTYEMPLTRGRVTKLGHAEWSETNGQDNEVSCPFQTLEDVLAFDAVEDYGTPPRDVMVREFQRVLDEGRRAYPGAVFPGGRYNTLFSACIRAFGWELFMMAARMCEDEFDGVLESFFRHTYAEMEAWLETDMPFYLCHDDIVWTSGAVFAPEWYRRHIFPRYQRLWAPVKASGRKVIFCADGNFTEFIDDVAAAGADGFIFEPTTSLERIVRDYGRTHVIVGNVDCRVLQFGTRADIRAEVERCISIGRECPGYFMAVGNHIPNGIPLDHVTYYFKVFEELRRR